MRRRPLTLELGSALAAAMAYPAAAQFTFAPVINNPLPEGHTPTSLVLRDLDADGKLDAVVSGRNLTDEEVRRTEVTILRGQGDGTFVPWQELLIPGGTGEWVVIEDFDRDSRLDLAVTISGAVGSIEVFRGTPSGFVPLASLPTEREPRGLAAADFNGDGTLDLANTNYSSSSLTVLLGDGGGGFAPWRSIRLAPHSAGIPFPYQVLVGDLDDDGNPRPCHHEHRRLAGQRDPQSRRRAVRDARRLAGSADPAGTAVDHRGEARRHRSRR